MTFEQFLYMLFSGNNNTPVNPGTIDTTSNSQPNMVNLGPPPGKPIKTSPVITPVKPLKTSPVTTPVSNRPVTNNIETTNINPLYQKGLTPSSYMSFDPRFFETQAQLSQAQQAQQKWVNEMDALSRTYPQQIPQTVMTMNEQGLWESKNVDQQFQQMNDPFLTQNPYRVPDTQLDPFAGWSQSAKDMYVKKNSGGNQFTPSNNPASSPGTSNNPLPDQPNFQNRRPSLVNSWGSWDNNQNPSNVNFAYYSKFK